MCPQVRIEEETHRTRVRTGSPSAFVDNASTTVAPSLMTKTFQHSRAVWGAARGTHSSIVVVVSCWATASSTADRARSSSDSGAGRIVDFERDSSKGITVCRVWWSTRSKSTTSARTANSVILPARPRAQGPRGPPQSKHAESVPESVRP